MKKKKQTENSLDFPIYTEFEEVLVYRDAMNNSEFQQVDVDNRHCVKSVRIQSFSGLHFHHIFPHLDWIQTRITPKTDTVRETETNTSVERSILRYPTIRLSTCCTFSIYSKMTQQFFILQSRNEFRRE